MLSIETWKSGADNPLFAYSAHRGTITYYSFYHESMFAPKIIFDVRIAFFGRGTGVFINRGHFPC